MMRIIALNEQRDSDECNDEDIQVTKEAEEAIAVSEYMRALSFKQKRLNKNALVLFTELLETQVLNEISLEDKNDKLFSVRYNCHKNLALIYEEEGDDLIAVEHFVKAMELDDSDVYTMNRLGQLTLKLGKLDISETAFRKCLTRNPNHWPSADGILQIYCLNENIISAYGWALKWYNKDKNYERAVNVLEEINEKFQDVIPFFESVWKSSYKSKKESMNENNKKSVFPTHDYIEPVEYMVTPDLKDFCIKTLSWLSIGKYIVNVYEHLILTHQSFFFILTIDEMLSKDKQEQDISNKEVEEEIKFDKDLSTKIEENVPKEAESTLKTCETIEMDTSVFVAPTTDISGNQTPQQSDSNAEDSDNQKAESEAIKPKPRRRCSDLSFLEQWGWHKNRKYTSRKKNQQDRTEVDTTVNSFLRRLFSKYFEENFDGEFPFLVDKKIEVDAANRKKQEEKNFVGMQSSYEDFQMKTIPELNLFLLELHSRSFDLILLVFLWLKYVSKFWNLPITEEMKELYSKIFKYYLNHFDLSTWNQLSNDDFNASFRMTLFFLEFEHEKALMNAKLQAKHELEEKWKMLFYHLRFESGRAFVISDDMYEENIIRHTWLDFSSAKFENDLNKAVECLLHLEYLLQNQKHGYKLILPNLHENNIIESDIIKTTRISLQRKISLLNVKKLYENNKFEDLIEILKDSLVSCTEIKNSDNTVMKIQTQFEVILESLWNIEKFEECLIWSERCLKYAVDNILDSPSDTNCYKEWAESINFILIYIEELIILESYETFEILEKYISRLVQTLIKILIHQLDGPFDKNNNPHHPINIKRSWIILHKILQMDEDKSPVIIKVKKSDTNTETTEIDDIIPHTFLLLFTGHEFLGKRQWCTRDNGQFLLYTLENIEQKFRAPYLDGCRDHIIEYLEQITYCLYGFPLKKARSRHIEEHDANQTELTWTRAIQLFSLYRPENLPEFNSYKLESISADMEQLLLRVLLLVPKEIDPNNFTSNITDYISGKVRELPQECCLLPYRISCIYYLLADYYFKCRDFSKTIKYYILDLTCEPTRFDSWAGLALSKASKLETKLNSCTQLNVKEFLEQSEDAIKCFKQCIKLKRNHTLLCIEFGSFAYIMHSFCSRSLKQTSDTLSMEKFSYVESKKENYLRISRDCFLTVEKFASSPKHDPNFEDNDTHDEKWLNHYMIGKIAEKRKEHPKIFLEHYLQAANFLYENNATYPIKINHSNPSNLAIEALEVFYRTNSAIVKYLEQHAEINREVGRLFTQVLKNLSNSPFAYNQAKIDDSSINALKRKLAEKADMSISKQSKPDIVVDIVQNKIETSDIKESTLTDNIKETTCTNSISNKCQSRPSTPNKIGSDKLVSPSRRGSQESSITTTTTATGTGTTSSTSSTDSSDSSSSESESSDTESGSTTDEETDKPDENSPLSYTELEPIYKSCVRNLEECITRFSEHYKSLYRLIHFYLYAPTKLRDLEKCKQLLVGTYKTSLGNQIMGLFADRKNNNFFNGIWRIPSSEIDRPGGFSSHLVKCVVILLEVFHKDRDYKTLMDLGFSLHRSPENDKRYIKESERKELYQQATSFCIQIMRETLKKYSEKPNDKDLLNLMLDSYRAYKKSIKHMNQKDSLFSQLLIDAYKLYIKDKVVKIPDGANILDLAVKLCLQEISYRKNQEKQAANITSNVNNPITTDPLQVFPKPNTQIPTTSTVATTKPIIPGITSRPRGRPVGSKNSTSTNLNQNLLNNINAGLDNQTIASLMAFYGSNTIGKDNSYFKSLLAEYYKILSNPALASAMNPILSAFSATSLNQAPVSQTKNLPLSKPERVTTPPPAKIPQFDIKNLIVSAASQVGKPNISAQSPSATISFGSGQLTITPTTSKSSISSIKETKQIHTASTLTASQIFHSYPKSSLSVSKVPSSSSLAHSKYSPDISTTNIQGLSSLQSLPELPKSLTITPAPSYSAEKSMKSGQQQQQLITPHISLHPEIPKTITKDNDKYVSKMKTAKKVSHNVAPYSKVRSPSLTNTLAFQNSLAALAQQIPFVGNSNVNNINQQMNLLNTYAEFVKNGTLPINPLPLTQLPEFQVPSHKRSYTKKPRIGKNQSRFPPPLSQLPIKTDPGIAMPSISKTLPKSSSPAFVPPYNLPLSKSPILAHSPISSPGGLHSIPSLPRNSITSPSITQSSPPKTLQQKLAEKQKANALNENSTNRPPSGSGGKRKNDVIILD